MTDMAAFAPTRRQSDVRLATLGDQAVELRVFNLTVAKMNDDTAQFEVVVMNSEPQLREAALMPADFDAVVVLNETDPALAKIHASGVGGASRDGQYGSGSSKFTQHRSSNEN